MSRRERVERKRETREDGREVGGEGVSAWAADQPSPRPLLQGSDDDFTVHSFISEPFLQEGQC